MRLDMCFDVCIDTSLHLVAERLHDEGVGHVFKDVSRRVLRHMLRHVFRNKLRRAY